MSISLDSLVPQKTGMSVIRLHCVLKKVTTSRPSVRKSMGKIVLRDVTPCSLVEVSRAMGRAVVITLL